MRLARSETPPPAGLQRQKFRLPTLAILAAILSPIGARPTFSQTCPSPATVTNTACTVTPGSTIVVTPANAVGLNTAGSSGQITGNGITVNLGAAGTTGAFAQSGGAIIFDGSTLNSTSAGAAAIGQTGLRATGAGSSVNATGATISLTPTGNSATMVGASAESGGALTFNNTNITTQTTATVAVGNNHGLVATGAGSRIDFTGGSVRTLGSRGSFGALAQSGGVLSLGGAAQIMTTGPQIVATSTGSHGLLSTGSGSQIFGSGITVSTAGQLASAARAENGGFVSLLSTSLSSSGAGLVDTDPASTARVLSGGTLLMSGAGSTITATASRSHGLSVQDAGSLATISDTTITASGARSNGVFAFSGGSASLTNTSVFTATTAAHALVAQDAGSSINLTDSSIRATGPVAFGLRTLAGTSSVVSGGLITTEGRDSTAIFSTNSSVRATGVAITTTGQDNSMAVLADLGGNIALVGGSVTTTGDSVRAGARAHGLAARNPGAFLSADGTTVLTRGQEGMGVVADDGGTVILHNNSVRTENRLGLGLFSVVEQSGSQFVASITGTGLNVETLGLNAYGVMAQQNFLPAPATVTIGNSAVTTHGENAMGLRAVSAGTVIANTSTVQTEGLKAHGLQSRDNGSSVTLNNTSVSSTGVMAHGALAEAGGLVTGNNSTVTASGASASALYAAGATGFVSNANFTGSVLTNLSGPTIGVGGVANVSLTNSIAGGSGQWLRVGTINDFPPLAAPTPPIEGIPDPDDPLAPPPLGFPPPTALPVVPGLANVTLSGATVTGTAFTAPGSVSNVSLLNNSTWNMTGDSNVTNLLNDPSIIIFSPPVGGVFKTLTTVNYIGQGGILAINTFLGSDASPSDKLVIDGGTATGNSAIRVMNAGGPGALTVANGILVVDAINGATTAPGAFALAAPVVAGPYEYTLHRSSVDASNPEAWYLRSTIDGGPSPPSLPNYRQETQLYAALPAFALSYTRLLPDTLHERVGEEEHLRGRADLNQGSIANGAWGRFIARHGDRDGESGRLFDRQSPNYDYDLFALQAGVDIYRKEHTDGSRDHAGVSAAIGVGRGSVDRADGGRAGDGSFNAYTLGAYWTHFGESGWYVDGVVQGTWFDMEASSHRDLNDLRTDGPGYAVSAELGYPLKFARGWIVEPQVQAIYQRIDLRPTNDGGASIRFSDVDSVLARAGARIAKTWAIGDELQPRLVSGWVRPNIWHEFRGNSKTEFSSSTGFIPFRADLGGTAAEIEVGATAQMTQNISLFASAGYQTSFDADTRSYDGRFGIRVNW